MVYWPLVTSHLIEVACHPVAELREAAFDALTRLVVSALAAERVPPIAEQPGMLRKVRTVASTTSIQ